MSLALDDWQIRRVLPHRAPILQLDRVEACSDALDTVAASKAVGGTDPMLLRGARTAFLAPGALVEGLAQCCGLLLRLRWLADQGTDIAEFASGDDSQCAPGAIPRSVLAESRAVFSHRPQPGSVIRFEVRLQLSRGGMHRFQGSAQVLGAQAVSAEIMLNFPYNS